MLSPLRRASRACTLLFCLPLFLACESTPPRFDAGLDGIPSEDASAADAEAEAGAEVCFEGEECTPLEEFCSGQVRCVPADDPSCADKDGDGVAERSCDELIRGWLLQGSVDDCDDDDPSRSPQTAEQCNDIDEDCDGEVDEGAGCPVFKDDSGSYAVRKLVVGNSHACALDERGQLVCWGQNDSGQLARAGVPYSGVPVRVDLGGKISDFEIGAFGTCALLQGELVCWGDHVVYPRVAGLPKGAVKLKILSRTGLQGDYYACVTDADAKVSCYHHANYTWSGPGAEPADLKPYLVNTMGSFGTCSVLEATKIQCTYPSKQPALLDRVDLLATPNLPVLQRPDAGIGQCDFPGDLSALLTTTDTAYAEWRACLSKCQAQTPSIECPAACKGPALTPSCYRCFAEFARCQGDGCLAKRNACVGFNPDFLRADYLPCQRCEESRSRRLAASGAVCQGHDECASGHCTQWEEDSFCADPIGTPYRADLCRTWYTLSTSEVRLCTRGCDGSTLCPAGSECIGAGLLPGSCRALRP